MIDEAKKTLMQIYCYTPKGKFTRIYILADGDPRLADRDKIWEKIKREYYSIEPEYEQHHWEDAEEEAEARAEWFASWDDEKCWEPMGDIAVDSHY